MNENLFLIMFLFSLVAYLFTLLGSLVVIFFKKVNKLFLDISLSLAAGIMLSASFYSLLLPSSVNVLECTIGFILGGFIIYIGNKVYSKFIINKDEKLKRVFMLVSSISLHNIPEGLSIGVAFANSSNIWIAIVFSIAIALQNFPEGSSVSLPLRREGYSRGKAFFYGQLSGIVEPIFAILGFILVSKIEHLMPFFMSLAAGAMIYVVVEELVPESQKSNKKDLMAIMTIIGFSIMMVLDLVLS